MKILLTKADVMKILCQHFNFKAIVVSSPSQPTRIEPEESGTSIFWEGNPEPEGA